MTVPLKWVPLADADDVPEGKAVLVKHERLEILIFHTATGWTAFDNTCPHAGAPIYAEHFDGDCVTCIYHGLRFRASDGACPDAAGWELEQYPARVEDGLVLVGFKNLG
jgi:apoptosis-inducing factor 3